MPRIRTCSSLRGKAGSRQRLMGDRKGAYVAHGRADAQPATHDPVWPTPNSSGRENRGETRHKLPGWIGHYLPGELAGTVWERGGAASAYPATGSLAATA